jgi:hypothetical protein
VTARAGRAGISWQMRQQQGDGAVRVVGPAYHITDPMKIGFPRALHADVVNRSDRAIGTVQTGFDVRDIVGAPIVGGAGPEVQPFAIYGSGALAVGERDHITPEPESEGLDHHEPSSDGQILAATELSSNLRVSQRSRLP